MQLQLTELRIAGFGGQGVILSAIVIGKAASIHQGAYATMTQNFGPEARGGACSAQLLISDQPVLYPYVTQPDVMIVISQEAYTRFVPELKEGGTLIVEQDLVRVTDLPRQTKVRGFLESGAETTRRVHRTNIPRGRHRARRRRR